VAIHSILEPPPLDLPGLRSRHFPRPPSYLYAPLLALGCWPDHPGLSAPSVPAISLCPLPDHGCTGARATSISFPWSMGHERLLFSAPRLHPDLLCASRFGQVPIPVLSGGPHTAHGTGRRPPPLSPSLDNASRSLTQVVPRISIRLPACARPYHFSFATAPPTYYSAQSLCIASPRVAHFPGCLSRAFPASGTVFSRMMCVRRGASRCFRFPSTCPSFFFRQTV